MSTATVFFSWQSDRPTKEGRNLIERALKSALERISKELTIDERPHELVLDKDIKGVPGSPPIFDTILGKIDRAAIFVPDLTFVAERKNGEPTPNPNVLIEYGYALKSLGHSRIVPVMNTAYGKPNRATMPFDLAHHAFPSPYDVPDGASDDERKAQREHLSKVLEIEIRQILAAETYKSSLAPVKPREYRRPLDGRARFRAKGEPIGFYKHPIASLNGRPESEALLSDGAAFWLRVIPQTPPTEPFNVIAIRKQVKDLSTLPLYNGYTSSFDLRGADGAGLAPVLDSNLAPAVVFMFIDGELWLIDTFPLQNLPKLILLDESGFSNSLLRGAEFLRDRFGIPGPFHWIAGFEGVRGRSMGFSNFARPVGPCASDLIEVEGDYRVGEDPLAAMEPFFAKVCEQCGMPRPPKNTTAANS
ncbi:MAG TPA: hypothetical protein VHW09_26930 [Bryobacteraceae bacterium]|jgi:hypothetical protein|nr:hypothetical protein [Bryobacteraceae bacterium]